MKPSQPRAEHSILLLSILSLVRVYQYLISPMRGQRCRFYPSCSNYALEALERYGPFKGGYLSIKRLLKCHPWHPGGMDPVPPKNAQSATDQAERGRSSSKSQ